MILRIGKGLISTSHRTQVKYACHCLRFHLPSVIVLIIFACLTLVVISSQLLILPILRLKKKFSTCLIGFQIKNHFCDYIFLLS